MGLDMYIYKVRRPKLDTTKVFEHDELRGYSRISVEDAKDEGIDSLIPYCQVVTQKVEYYDTDKLGKERKLQDVRSWHWYGEGVSFSGRDRNGTRQEFDLTEEEISKNYTLTKEEQMYVWEEQEVYYWRKAYDIQKFVYENYPVQNLGYYKLSTEFIKELNKKFDEGVECWEPDDAKALFYHEWY